MLNMSGFKMRIKIKLIAPLYRHLESNQLELDVEEGSTIRDVIDNLNILKAFPILVLKNGKHTKPKEKLEDGDSLTLVPVMGGG